MSKRAITIVVAVCVALIIGAVITMAFNGISFF